MPEEIKVLSGYNELLEHYDQEHGMQILPAFPSLIATVKMNFNSDINELKKIKLRPTGVDTSTNCYTSNTVNILDEFPVYNQMFLNTYKIFAKKILGFENIIWKISTSWLTMVDTGGESQLHAHRNSFYSAVYYFDDVQPEHGGVLQIVNLGLSRPDLYVGTPQHETILNTNSLGYKPEKNLLVFFPSYLQHKVSRYYGQIHRYSLAMNFIPIPPFGEHDSTYAL